jgi:hypothetical protein
VSDARSARQGLIGAGWAAGGLIFIVIATANAGGYRFGASDQAFHIPAVIRALDPAAFPHDAALIDAQARLTVFYTAVAGIVRATGASLETVFLAGYLVSVALVWLAVLLIGGRLFQSAWATAALAAIVTLRHRIPKSSVNSLEPYFYPRMLAFAVGLLAIASVLRRRTWIGVSLVVVSAIVHPTTGAWFGILIGVAALVLEPRARPIAATGGVVMAITGTWALVAGPLADSLTHMDAVWLAAVESKDDLFPPEWPTWAWAANLALPLLLIWTHRIRAARRTASREDDALVRGGFALAVFFLLMLPAVAARWALPIQLQVSRVFWLIDFLVAVYLVALVTEHVASTKRRRLPILAGVALAIALGRGTYVMAVEFPERKLFETHLRQTPWQDAMSWLKQQPIDIHVWADPGHAWKYGSSVRVAAGRDVFLEETKDSAVAIYSRDVAMRVLERRGLQLSPDRGQLDAAQVRALSDRYGVDYVVTEGRMNMTPAFENSQFRIYSIGERPATP